jgi:hypothetical protein
MNVIEATPGNPGTPLGAVMQTAQAAGAGVEEVGAAASAETAAAGGSDEVARAVEESLSGIEESSTSTNVPCIDAMDSPMHHEGIVYNIELFGTGCLECKHLVDDADVDYKVCHFSKGNMACPAAYIRIKFIGDRVKWEHRVKKLTAMPRGSDRTNRMLMLVEQAKEIESDALREHVLQMIGL